MSDLLTVNEYARYRGLTPAAVYLAIKDGRLTCEEIKGKKFIIREKADREWKTNTDRRQGTNEGLDGSPQANGLALDNGSDPSSENGTPVYAVSRAKREFFAAEKAKLEFEKIEGSLVPKTEVVNQAREAATILRDALLNIPPKLAAEIAAETDPANVERRLEQEIREALASARDRLQMGEGDGEESSSIQSGRVKCYEP